MCALFINGDAKVQKRPGLKVPREGITIVIMTQRNRKNTAYVFNCLIAVCEIYALGYTFFRNGSFDYTAFQFYTNDSNILALVSSLVYLQQSGRGRTAERMRYASSSCLSLTFIVVLLVLIPSDPESAGYLLLDRACFFEHLVVPVLSFVSFVFFEKNSLMKRDAVRALVPTLSYAAAAVILNVARIIEGPYPFLRIHVQSPVMSVLWFVVIAGGAYLISLGLLVLSGKVEKKCSGFPEHVSF